MTLVWPGGAPRAHAFPPPCFRAQNWECGVLGGRARVVRGWGSCPPQRGILPASPRTPLADMRTCPHLKQGHLVTGVSLPPPPPPTAPNDKGHRFLRLVCDSSWGTVWGRRDNRGGCPTCSHWDRGVPSPTDQGHCEDRTPASRLTCPGGGVPLRGSCKGHPRSDRGGRGRQRLSERSTRTPPASSPRLQRQMPPLTPGGQKFIPPVIHSASPSGSPP